jgi:3-hydroxyisobutyrate dehydrogenase-like beta-hydroxyacid dehydrogenase
MTTVAILHPGQMGSSIAAAAVRNHHSVLWCSAGRSPSTAARANQYKLTDTGELAALCERADVLLSVCPPDCAIQVATEVAALDYRGIFVDCNAIAARSARQVAAIVSGHGAAFVDGGIIGPPAWQPETTRLYLSGGAAQQVATLFSDSALDARVIKGDIGAASALKMAYAGWNKGSAALLAAVYAYAEHAGVSGDLLGEWALSQPGLQQRLEKSAVGNAVKAWRFTGEMSEIGDSLDASGLPRGFFDAAHDTFDRLAKFKHQGATVGEGIKFDDVIAALLKRAPQ